MPNNGTAASVVPSSIRILEGVMRFRLMMVLAMVVAVVGLGCSKAEVKDSAHKAGDAVEDAAHTTADVVGDAAQTTADAVDDAVDTASDTADDS